MFFFYDHCPLELKLPGLQHTPPTYTPRESSPGVTLGRGDHLGTQEWIPYYALLVAYDMA